MIPHKFLKDSGSRIIWMVSKVKGNSSAGERLLGSNSVSVFNVTPKHVLLGVESSSSKHWEDLVMLKSTIQQVGIECGQPELDMFWSRAKPVNPQDPAMNQAPKASSGMARMGRDEQMKRHWLLE